CVRIPREVRRRPHRRRRPSGPKLRGTDRLGQVEPALVFAGYMGAGKSSAAKAVAAELGVQALDSDHEIERELGEPIESWFERNGEAAFRTVEEEAVLRLLARDD